MSFSSSHHADMVLLQEERQLDFNPKEERDAEAESAVIVSLGLSAYCLSMSPTDMKPGEARC